MLKEQRQQLILDIVQEAQQVTVSELSGHFDVSEVTIRRDLRQLAEQGALRRTHGGALAALQTLPETPVAERMLWAERCKAFIGKTAAELVADDMSVFIGSGSTTAYVARNLVSRRGLTVVTNAINIAAEFATAHDTTVVVTGGLMRTSELSLIGHITELALQQVRVDKAIIGMRAINLKAGMTNDYLPEVVTDRTIIDLAPELIVVADHTKFGQVASAYVAPVERISTLVTDSTTDPHTLSELESMGVRVIVAQVQRF
jgi:DeoR/GlpR family transcriptional regulator of sugar metabolism